MGILASFQAVLTMSGIDGIVLSLGMAVEPTCLSSSVLRKSFVPARTFATPSPTVTATPSLQSSTRTLPRSSQVLSCFCFGTGPIKGFATTLIIGLVCSFFTAVYTGRLFFLWFIKTDAFNNLTFSTGLSRKMFINTKHQLPWPAQGQLRYSRRSNRNRNRIAW